MKKALSMLLLIAASSASAAQVSDAGVNYVGVYGDGRVFASLDTVVPVNGCESATWIVLPSTHAHKKELYSLLLSAKTAGRKIDVNSTSCISSSATITEGTSDYILVK